MGDYTTGPATYRKHPRVETKPTGYSRAGRQDSGGGYERVRSWEFRPETPGEDKEDVYASIHRLNAVAWLLPEDDPLDLSILDGVDVHHSAPEVEADRGIPWDNREDCLHTVDHGRHSEITQRELLTAAKVTRDRAREPVDIEDSNACVVCDATDAELWTCPEFDGPRCTECSMLADPDSTLEPADA